MTEVPLNSGPLGSGLLRVGDSAPDFTLPGIDGSTGIESTFSLTDFLGTPVILAFYPADRSPVCTRQLVSYTRDIGLLDHHEMQLLAISPQSPESHQSFAASHDGFAFPLLSDIDKAVGRSYGIIGLLDLYKRSTFLLDRDGVVRYVHRAFGPGLTFRKLDELVALVETERLA